MEEESEMSGDLSEACWTGSLGELKNQINSSNINSKDSV